MSNNVFIYLAGPITGQLVEDANGWRNHLCRELDEVGMIGVSPLRCEPVIGEVYTTEYDDNKFGTPQVIAAKNKMDVARCDLTLAYQPHTSTWDPPLISIGTQQEIGWAVGMGKPVILVTDNNYVRNNAVIKATVPWRFQYNYGQGFDEALDVIAGLFGVYK